MREWLLGLVPVVLIVDVVLHPAHLAWFLAGARTLLR
jgi:hypothetical protein